MRLGLDLRGVPDTARRRDLAIEADRLGLWAVLVGGPAGAETVEASALATATAHVHLAVWLDGRAVHPLTLAEEVAVLDHLSARRALAVVDAVPGTVEHVRKLLGGHVIGGVALAPPPAQTALPVWSATETPTATLTGRLDEDRATIDTQRESGCTHLFVAWPGALTVLARHLATRAAGPDFPQLVADLADVVEPL